MTESDDDVTRRTGWQPSARGSRGGAQVSRRRPPRSAGAVVPQLVNGGRTAYIVLGGGLRRLGSCGVRTAAAVRRRDVERALDRGQFADVGAPGVLVLTLVPIALALGTLGVIVAQP